MKIKAIDKKTNEEIEITDLYFFEEEGIHDFKGEGFHDNYTFKFVVEPNDIIENAVAGLDKEDLLVLVHTLAFKYEDYDILKKYTIGPGLFYLKDANKEELVNLYLHYKRRENNGSD